MGEFMKGLVGGLVVLAYLFIMGALAHLGWYFLQAGWNLG